MDYSRPLPPGATTRHPKCCATPYSILDTLAWPTPNSAMPIYGTALLAACLLIGVSIGKLLGTLVGVDADIGGVGVAMLLLIFSSDWLRRRGLMSPPSESGIIFWGQIYVPIVVAMAASQNVRGALGGGVMAFLAGAVTVAICFALVKILARAGRSQEVSR